MPWKPPKYSKRKTSQRINLRDLFGRAVKDSEKQQFAERALELIKERTQSNKSFSPRGRSGKFKPYSKKYAEAKGVSRNDVNLTLSETMLNSQNLLKSTRDTIEIGIDDDRSAPISYNHNVGDTLPKRRFFGLTKKEAESIAEEMNKGTVGLSRQEKKTVREALEELGGLTFERVDGD